MSKRAECVNPVPISRLLQDRDFAQAVEIYAPIVLHRASRGALIQTFGSMGTAIKVGLERSGPTLINGQLGAELDFSTPQRTIKLLAAKNPDGSTTILSCQEGGAIRPNTSKTPSGQPTEMHQRVVL